MLNKYDFTNKDDVIDQPSIMKITSDLVLIIHAGGTNTEEIPEEGLVILIGNIDSFIPPTTDPIDPDDPVDPTPTPTPEDGITMTAMIVNNADGRLNIRQLLLLLWDGDNQQIQSVTGTVTTNNRIEQGSSAQCTVIFEKEYEGLNFASEELYSDYLCNCGYKINGSNYTFTTSGVSESYIFQDGGSFTVTIPNDTTEWMGGEQTPTYDTDPDPQPQPSGDASWAENTGGNGIRYVLHNNSNVEARFSGAVVLNLSRNPNDWSNYQQAYAHMWQSTEYHTNDIIIPPGGTYASQEVTDIKGILQPTIDFTDGTWYLMNTMTGVAGHPVYLYTREYSRSRNAVSGSNHMYAATPTVNTKLQNGYTYHLNVNWVNPDAMLADANLTKQDFINNYTNRYAILALGQTDLK